MTEKLAMQGDVAAIIMEIIDDIAYVCHAFQIVLDGQSVDGVFLQKKKKIQRR